MRGPGEDPSVTQSPRERGVTRGNLGPWSHHSGYGRWITKAKQLKWMSRVGRKVDQVAKAMSLPKPKSVI